MLSSHNMIPNMQKYIILFYFVFFLIFKVYKFLSNRYTIQCIVSFGDYSQVDIERVLYIYKFFTFCKRYR